MNGRRSAGYDYFGQLFDWACKPVMSGDAYVDELSFDDARI